MVYLHRSTMPRGKEISEDISKKVLTAHQSGESYKTITKGFQLHPSTVRQIIYKWKAFNMTPTLPRSGRPSKRSPRSTRKIINRVKAVKPRNLNQKRTQTRPKAVGTICLSDVAGREIWNIWSLCVKQKQVYHLIFRSLLVWLTQTLHRVNKY